MGHLSPLPRSQLTTKADVVSYIRRLSSAKKSTTNNIFRKAAEEVSEIWANEVIPIYDQYYG